jgi:hypothetical protein
MSFPVHSGNWIAARQRRRARPARPRGGHGNAGREDPRSDFRTGPDDPDAQRGDSADINRRSLELETEMDAMTLLMLAIAILLTLDVVATQLR